MPSKFQELLATPAVLRAQDHYYGKGHRFDSTEPRDVLGAEEIEFIHSRDSFYLSTIGENGWPYVQHRGGDIGFLHVLGPKALVFADYHGNRQLLSTGNLAVNQRTALFLMDYPQRTRLKILGHARMEDAKEHPQLVAQLTSLEKKRIVERFCFIDVVAFDWNCPKYIKPRYTAEEIQTAIAPLQDRIAELEAELKTVRSKSGTTGTPPK